NNVIKITAETERCSAPSASKFGASPKPRRPGDPVKNPIGPGMTQKISGKLGMLAREICECHTDTFFSRIQQDLSHFCLWNLAPVGGVGTNHVKIALGD